MSPEETGSFIEDLETHGLTFFDGEVCVDIVVIDQNTGPTAPCPWIRWGPDPTNTLTTAWMTGTDQAPIAVPEGHRPGRRMHFVADSDSARIVQIGNEAGVGRFLDTATGQILYAPTSDMPLADGALQSPPPARSRIPNFVLFVGGVIGLIVGSANHGLLGALTGVSTAFWASATIKIAVSGRGAVKAAGIAATLIVVAAATMGGWQWGWITAAIGIIVALLVARLIVR